MVRWVTGTSHGSSLRHLLRPIAVLASGQFGEWDQEPIPGLRVVLPEGPAISSPLEGGFQLSRANRQEAGSRGRCHVGVSQPRILNPVSGHELCDSRNGSLTLSEPYLQPPTSACGSNGRPPVWCSTVALPVEVDA